MAMDGQQRQQVVLAATAAAGPVGEDPAGWRDRVYVAAREIALACNPHSRVGRAVDTMAAVSKVFSATVTGIETEPSSTRGLVTLHTRPSEWYPDGVEQVRTERTDQADGAHMYGIVEELVGHRVMVFVEQQETGQGKAVRVVRHVEDLGVPAGRNGAAQSAHTGT